MLCVCIHNIYLYIYIYIHTYFWTDESATLASRAEGSPQVQAVESRVIDSTGYY